MYSHFTIYCKEKKINLFQNTRTKSKNIQKRTLYIKNNINLIFTLQFIVKKYIILFQNISIKSKKFKKSTLKYRYVALRSFRLMHICHFYISCLIETQQKSSTAHPRICAINKYFLRKSIQPWCRGISGISVVILRDTILQNMDRMILHAITENVSSILDYMLDVQSNLLNSTSSQLMIILIVYLYSWYPIRRIETPWGTRLVIKTWKGSSKIYTTMFTRYFTVWESIRPFLLLKYCITVNFIVNSKKIN